MGRSVRIYLCRHAHAAPGSPDVLRPLSPAGRRRAVEMGVELTAASPRPMAVVTSPLVRARQTADEIARGLGVHARADANLSPGATVEALCKAVAREEGGLAVVAVGHQPDCSEIMVALTGDDPGFPPGAIHVVDLHV
jgi:phosphohistidine phosphatase